MRVLDLQSHSDTHLQHVSKHSIKREHYFHMLGAQMPLLKSVMVFNFTHAKLVVQSKK